MRHGSIEQSSQEVLRRVRRKQRGAGIARDVVFFRNTLEKSPWAWSFLDGPTNGYIKAFVPLVDLEESLGPTTILPRTHAMPDHYVRTNDSKDGSDVVTLDDHTGDDTGNDDGDGVVQLLPITPMRRRNRTLLLFLLFLLPSLLPLGNH